MLLLTFIFSVAPLVLYVAHAPRGEQPSEGWADTSADPAWKHAVIEQFTHIQATLADGYVNLALFAICISASIVTFALTVDGEFRHSKARFSTIEAKIDAATDRLRQEVIEALQSPKIQIMKSGESLRELQSRIASATVRIFLMYFAEKPSRDVETENYWTAVTKSFVSKNERQVPICRLVSVDNVNKLIFLLENNELLFSLAPNGHIGGVDYTLVALQHLDAKPPQLDIVDDAAFWFSTFAARGRKPPATQLIADPRTVEAYATYYESLVERLPPRSVLLATKDKAGAPHYSIEEVDNILTALVGCGFVPEESLSRVWELLVKRAPSAVNEAAKLEQRYKGKLRAPSPTR